MMKRIPAIAVAIIASSLIGAPVALADSQTDHMPKSEAPATSPNDMPGMKQGAMPNQGMMPDQGAMPNQGAMSDQGMMPGMKQGGDMMGMMTMMSQMQAMMGACTTMMKAMTPGDGMQEDTAPGSSG